MINWKGFDVSLRAIWKFNFLFFTRLSSWVWKKFSPVNKWCKSHYCTSCSHKFHEITPGYLTPTFRRRLLSHTIYRLKIYHINFYSLKTPFFFQRLKLKKFFMVVYGRVISIESTSTF